jgi:hypothetical protein
MINVHLNGDIVRCPDIAAIQTRLKEKNDQEHRCIYGTREIYCNAWQNYIMRQSKIQSFSDFGRCFLHGCDLCDMHKKKVEYGNKEKTFSINPQVYRKITSGAHYMVKETIFKTLFITLTFPKFKKQPDEKDINKCFSKFMHNLHENYDVTYYIAVRELGKKYKRYHFHVLLAIKFFDFHVLNTAWCSAISDISDFSKNALQTDPKTLFISRPGKALRYCCKYFAKQRGSKSKTRLVFMSLPLILKPKKEYCCIEDILKGYKSIYIQQTSDFTTCFRITDSKEFDRFCNQYLYALFELSDKKTDFIGLNY